MKKCLLLLTFAAATSLVWAQDQDQDQGQSGAPAGHRGHRMGTLPSPAKQAQRLSKELGLSSDQTTKIQKIFEDQQKKHEAEMSSNEELSPEQRRADFMQARQEVDSQIEAVLTDAQKQKFEQLKSKRGRHGPGAPGGPEGQQSPPPDDQQQPQ
jgi:Spy/CpxP family protein refolding chaperone